MSQQINLYNPILLAQKHYFSARTMAQALAAVVLGAYGMYGFQAWQNRALERALTDTEARTALQRAQVVSFSKEYSAQGASRALVDELARAEQRLLLRRGLLDDLTSSIGGNAEGFSPVLSALARQTLPGVWLTGLEIGSGDGALVIKGRALESQLVPVYIRSLNREAPMAGSPIRELRMTASARAAAAPAGNEPSQYIDFQLSMPRKGKS